MLVHLGFSATTRSLDGGNIDFPHLHHGFECALGNSRIWVCDGLHQGYRRDLPRQPPFVFAPTASARLSAIVDDGVPVAVCLGLIDIRDLERKRITVLAARPTI